MRASRSRYDLLLRLWPLGKIPHWLGNLPLIGPLFDPCLKSDDSEALIIPVQQAIQGTESVALPYTLLPFLARQASARFILLRILTVSRDGNTLCQNCDVTTTAQ